MSLWHCLAAENEVMLLMAFSCFTGNAGDFYCKRKVYTSGDVYPDLGYISGLEYRPFISDLFYENAIPVYFMQILFWFILCECYSGLFYTNVILRALAMARGCAAHRILGRCAFRISCKRCVVAGAILKFSDR